MSPWGRVYSQRLTYPIATQEEMWQPNKSTILQVLLSITSMILG